MDVVETEEHGQVLVVRMNRRAIDALNHEMRTRLAETWTEFRHSEPVRGRDFYRHGTRVLRGEDMKESLAAGTPWAAPGDPRPVQSGALEKPVIAAVTACDGRRLHAGRAHRSAGRGEGRRV